MAPYHGAAPGQGRPAAPYDPRSVRAIDVIVSGPTRQHPPISRAPASRQPVTRDAENVGSPVQARARASHRSPLFGYTTTGLPVTRAATATAWSAS